MLGSCRLEGLKNPPGHPVRVRTSPLIAKHIFLARMDLTSHLESKLHANGNSWWSGLPSSSRLTTLRRQIAPTASDMAGQIPKEAPQTSEVPGYYDSTGENHG